MKIVVDYDLCEANAVCVSWAQDVFYIADDNRLHLTVERVGPELLSKVRDAVNHCPREALSLAPEDGEG